MTERSAERRARQETDRLACGPLLRVGRIRRTTDTFLFISHTTNVNLFKFRCNIFIGVGIIKEMLGSVASGTHCIFSNRHSRYSSEKRRRAALCNLGTVISLLKLIRYCMHCQVWNPIHFGTKCILCSFQFLKLWGRLFFLIKIHYVLSAVFADFLHTIHINLSHRSFITSQLKCKT